MKSKRLMISLAALVGIGLAVPAPAAEQFPTRPIKMVVAFPPGGPVDVAAREVATGLGKILEQPVIVENRPGANGNLAPMHVLREPADGYTLSMHTTTQVLTTALYAKPPYTLKDFRPIGNIMFLNNVFVVRNEVKANNLKEVLALAKSTNGAMTYGSTGTGSAQHVLYEMLKTQTDVRMTHVPYKGGAPLLNDLLGGHVEAGTLSISLALPYIKSGKLRPIAVASATRSVHLPEVPTFVEQGINVVLPSFIGLAVRADTPPDVVRIWRAALQKHLSDPQTAKRIKAMGNEIAAMDSDAFSAFMADQEKQLDRLKAAGLVIH